MICAHIAGMPVEETVLSFAPVGLLGVSVAALRARDWLGTLRGRLPAARRRDAVRERRLR